ncbi:MAG: hypothetical protein NWF04_04670 [Candidatus Bathyarchaeota archaeon]|nr:hypothetical protein [Candidatus Bathyarchaeota archaeon]
MSKKRPVKHTDIETFEPKENQELETEDIYDDKQRETMLKEDEITASENAFMQGREMNLKKNRKATHDDSISVELSKQEYEED